MIRTVNLCKRYVTGGQEIHPIVNLSMRVARGTCLLLWGPSGSGKSTLLNLISCLTRPTSGSIEIDGNPVTDLPDHFLTEVRRRRIGIVFQAYNLLHGYRVLESVALPLIPLGTDRTERHRKARRLLGSLNLEHKADSRVNELSGGEQQRVAIARALINDPDILLADEPNSNIDDATSALVLDLFSRLKKDGKTLVVSTHSHALERSSLVDQVLQLGDAA